MILSTYSRRSETGVFRWHYRTAQYSTGATDFDLVVLASVHYFDTDQKLQQLADAV